MEAHPQWWNVKGQPLASVISECISAKLVANRRINYVKELQRSLLRFAAGREHMDVSAISPSDIEQYFAGFSLSTRDTQMNRLSALFAWCERRGYIHANPVRRLERVIIDRPSPRILKEEEASKLLELTATKQPPLLGFVVLGLFAGIRPSELDRLDWAAVDIEHATVRIDAAASKTRRRRIVPLEPKAIHWLNRLARRSGPVVDCNRPHHMQRLAKFMGWENWPADILRHSCASFWTAKYQDADKVALWLGNSVGVLLRHYHQLVTHEEMLAFWSVVP